MHRQVIEPLESRRLLYAGELDTTFGAGGIALAPAGATRQFNDVVVLDDGRILAAGTGVGGTTGVDFTLARFNADGSPDATFGGGDGLAHVDFFARDDVAEKLELLPDGKILIGGTAQHATDGPAMALARLNADGSIDPSFGTAGRATVRFGSGDAFGDFTVQPDGTIVVVGGTLLSDSTTGRDVAVARLNDDGSSDTTFGGGDGRITVDPWHIWLFPPEDDLGAGVVVQSNGRIVVLNDRPEAKGWSLVGLTSSGEIDATFAGYGFYLRGEEWYWTDWATTTPDLLLDPVDDALYVSSSYGNGLRPDLGVFRVTAAGKPDNSWGSEVKGPDHRGWQRSMFDADYGWAFDLTYSRDGAYLLQSGCANGMFAVVRYVEATGAVDTTFGAGGIATANLGGATDMPDVAAAIAAPPDGAGYVLAGTHAGGYRAAITRHRLAGGAAAPKAWPTILPLWDGGNYSINSEGVFRLIGTEGNDIIWYRPDTESDSANPEQFWAYIDSGPGGSFSGKTALKLTAIVINGLGGNDVIVATMTGLPVSIQGGAGNDSVVAGPGNDSISGNSGKDKLDGGGGDDRVAGNGGVDGVVGNTGNDRLYGDAGGDILESGAGNDRIYGGADNDVVAGGAGSDTLYGEAGRDTLTGGGGNDKAYDVAYSDVVVNIGTIGVSTATMPPPHILGATFRPSTVALVLARDEDDALLIG